MKILPRRPQGFTLIELLVVIAIIAILAGAGFAAGQAAIQRARKVTTLNVATSLEQAVNNFYGEYGYLPARTSDGETDKTFQTNEADGKWLVLALTGRETGTSQVNTKAINYLTVKEGKKVGTGGRDGMIYDNSGNADGIYDPWAGSYKIRLDLDYDEKLTVRPKGANADRVLNARKVAVWSDGADGAGSANGKAADDVMTW